MTHTTGNTIKDNCQHYRTPGMICQQRKTATKSGLEAHIYGGLRWLLATYRLIFSQSMTPGPPLSLENRSTIMRSEIHKVRPHNAIRGSITATAKVVAMFRVTMATAVTMTICKASPHKSFQPTLLISLSKIQSSSLSFGTPILPIFASEPKTFYL